MAVTFLKTFRELKEVKDFDVESSLLIFDQTLKRFPAHQKVISLFPNHVGFVSGEKLKDFNQAPKNLAKVFREVPIVARSEMSFVAMGGGSLGDFSGFAASVFQRGVNLVQMPTTWLAAMDSAHGGKNAMNFGKSKNQIGTFHFPQSVVIVQELLPKNKDLCADAFGELLKAVLLKSQLRRNFLQAKKIDHHFMWEKLPLAIRVKNEIVGQDPFESKKIRYALNLGHSLGHAFEVVHGVPHGFAILMGVEFAVEWSVRRKLLSQKFLQDLQKSALVKAWHSLKAETSFSGYELRHLLKNEEALLRSLKKDKKKKNAMELDEVFLDQNGFRVLKTSYQEFQQEMRRQKSFSENIF